MNVKQKFQRLLSLFLVIAMLASSVPAQVGAEGSIEQRLSDGAEVGDFLETEDSGEETNSNEQEGIEEQEESEQENDDNLPEEVGDNGNGIDLTEQEISEQKNNNLLMNKQLNERERLELKVKESFEKAKKFYENNPPLIEGKSSTHSSNFWIFSAFWGAGYQDIKNNFPWTPGKTPWEDFSVWQTGEITSTTIKGTEHAGFIIGAVIAGKDPRKFGNETNRRDLVKELIAIQNPDGSLFNGYDSLWAFIALDLVDADYDRDGHIRHIISEQTASGMFYGVDGTGWFLLALAPYQYRPDVEEAIKKAIDGLYNQFKGRGHFAPKVKPGTPDLGNSNSDSCAIWGLAAVGEDLYSDKWVYEGTHLLDHFIDRYQIDSGRFKWRDDDSGSWAMATEQAFLALTDIIEKESVYSRLKEYRRNVLDRTTVVSLRIEGMRDTIYSQKNLRIESINEEATVLEVLKQALAESNILYKLAGTGANVYVTNIGGEEAGSFQDFDGWKYVVNGEKSSIDIGQYTVHANDEIVFYYGNESDIHKGKGGADHVEKLTLIPKITITPNQPSEGEEINVIVTATYDVYDEADRTIEKKQQTNIKDALVHFNGKTYLTDKDGVARIPDMEAKAGAYELKVTKDIENSYPRLLRQVKKLTIAKKVTDGGEGDGDTPAPSIGSITISVQGPVGEGNFLAPKTITLEAGDTAYSVLERAMPGQVSATGDGATLYVQAIAGLAEFDRGPDSGWMYQVNGIFPDYSAGIYHLNDGDRVDWRYTKNLGKDINGYIPDVEKDKNPGMSGGEITPGKVKEEVDKLAFSANNLKPVHELGRTVIVLNKEKRMSRADADALQKALSKNNVNLHKTIKAHSEDSLYDIEKEVELFVPKGAVTTETDFRIKKISDHGYNEAVSGVFSFSPAGTTFNLAVQISIKTPLFVEELEHLTLAWWNEETKQWIPIPAVIDAETGIVTGLVDHFTTFAVIDKSKLDNFTENELYAIALNDALKWLKQKNEWSEWGVISLARSGETIPPAYVASLEKLVKSQNGEFRKVTDYERITLALTAIGEEPSTFAGYHLLEKIYNNERMTVQGINGPTFALIALDSKAYEVPKNALWTREKLIQYILLQQNEDGSFSLSSEQKVGDVDLTAMVLQGLTPYKEKQEVKQAIDKAINWLSLEQNEAGGYRNAFGDVNSESVAQVLIALTGLDIQPETDPRFVKAKGNLISHLLNYVEKDGGFSHIKGQGSNGMATEQAVLALVAYDRSQKGEPALYDMRQVKQVISKPQRQPLPFVDVANISSWALDAVERAYKLGYVQGVGGKVPRFEPKRAVTRAEFTTLLVNVTGISASVQELSFEDVRKEHWYYDSISTAVAKGWIKGVNDKRFNPNEAITREEMAVIIGRILLLENRIEEESLNLITDAQDVSIWAKAMVSQVYKEGILIGNEQRKFTPKEATTREMGAMLVVRLHDRFESESLQK